MRQKGNFNREVFFLQLRLTFTTTFFYLSFCSIDSMSKNKRLMVSMHASVFIFTNALNRFLHVIYSDFISCFNFFISLCRKM